MEGVGVPGERCQSRPRAVRGDALYKSCVFLLLPIEEVVQVIHECGLVQNTLLCKRMQIIRVCESLDELELELEADPIRCLGLINRRLRHLDLDICEVSVGTWRSLHSKVSVSPCGRSNQKRKVTRPVCHSPLLKLSHPVSPPTMSSEENSGWNLTESGI